MFLHVSVILFTGGGCAIPACIAGSISACLAAGGSAPRVGLLPGEVSSQGGACSGWGCLLCGGEGGVETPPKADGYCCGRYASYWNAFLFTLSDCKAKFFPSSLSLLNVNIKLDFLWTHLEVMSLSHQYKRTLTKYKRTLTKHAYCSSTLFTKLTTAHFWTVSIPGGEFISANMTYRLRRPSRASSLRTRSDRIPCQASMLPNNWKKSIWLSTQASLCNYRDTISDTIAP